MQPFPIGVGQALCKPGSWLLDSVADQHAQSCPKLSGRKYILMGCQLLFQPTQIRAGYLQHICTHALHQLFRGTVNTLLSRFQNRQLVAAFGFVHIVSGDKNAGALVAEIE